MRDAFLRNALVKGFLIMIGIITATKEEFAALNQALNTNKTGIMNFTRGMLGGKQVAGVQAFGHASYGEVYGAVSGCAYGAVNQLGERLTQGYGGAAVRAAELRRHVPGEAYAAILRGGGGRVVL